MEFLASKDIRKLRNPGVVSEQLLSALNSPSQRVKITRVTVDGGTAQPRHRHEGSERTEPMRPAGDQVMNLIFGRWRSQVLSVAVELGLFDYLHKRKPQTAETLAARLDADPSRLYRLLKAQAVIGLLEEDGSRGFVLTQEGDLLRSDHPQSLQAMVRLASKVDARRLLLPRPSSDRYRRRRRMRPVRRK